MKTAMQEGLEKLDLCRNAEDAKSLLTYLLILEKNQMFDLIRFMRNNDKMGKSVEDLYNEFYNQNK